MRFSFKYTLWVIFVYTASLSLFTPSVRTHWDARRFFVSTRNDLRQITTAAEEYDRANSQPPSLETLIERCLDQGLLPTKAGGTMKFRFDRWGRPYQFEHQLTLPDGRVVEYGAYSLGRDGISNSFGNDLDDINSWSTPSSFA